MRRLTMLGVAVMVSLAACGGMTPRGTTGSAEDEAAIRALTTRYAQANTERNAAALTDLMADDYEAVLPDGTHLSGRAAMQRIAEQDFAAMPAGVNATVTATTDYVRWLSSDAAVAGGTWSMSGAPVGAGPDRGAWMGAFRREADGRWRMINGLGAAHLAMPVMPDTVTR